MTGADRPLSLARLRVLPPGARIRDVRGVDWVRQPMFRDGKPGWWARPDGGLAPGAHLHAHYRPLRLIDGGGFGV